jgi:opacity protein-like surface antigen
MKNVLKTGIFLVFVLISLSSQAQIKFGVKGGLNASNLTGYSEIHNLLSEIGLGDLKSQSKLGFHVGAVAQIGLPANFFIQPELLYSSLGVKIKMDSELLGEASKSNNLNYLQLPVYAGYKFNAGLGLDIIVGVGPYIGYGISATNDWFNKDSFKKFDYGLSALAGIQFEKFQITAGYDFGLNDIMDVPNWESLKDLGNFSSLSNRNIKISLAYFF